jgi:uncharacterized protein YlxW (UPF0749 family)
MSDEEDFDLTEAIDKMQEAKERRQEKIENLKDSLEKSHRFQ